MTKRLILSSYVTYYVINVSEQGGGGIITVVSRSRILNNGLDPIVSGASF